MTIRAFLPRDREKLQRILRQRDTFTQEEIRVALELLDEASSHPEREEYWVFCAVDAGEEPVGYICFGPIPMTEAAYDLYWIAVEEGASRRGIGAGLVRFMEERVRQRGATQIYVDTSSTAPYDVARAFYEKSGYRVVCTLPDFYREGDHKVLFVKRFSNPAGRLPERCP